jgi:hypothetical protein
MLERASSVRARSVLTRVYVTETFPPFKGNFIVQIKLILMQIEAGNLLWLVSAYDFYYSLWKLKYRDKYLTTTCSNEPYSEVYLLSVFEVTSRRLQSWVRVLTINQSADTINQSADTINFTCMWKISNVVWVLFLFHSSIAPHGNLMYI